MRAGGRRRRIAAAVGAGALFAACAPRAVAPPVVLPPAPVTPAAGEAAAPADTVPRPTPGGDGDRRFLIVAFDDSTVTMLAPRERWVRRGMYGIAVDPRRRDALVARLFVQSRMGDSAVALVTGQTTRLSTDYVAIFRRPEIPVLRQGSFWGGIGTGVVFGAVLAAFLFRGP